MLENPGNQCSSGVAAPAGGAVEDHQSEANSGVVAPGGCVVDCSAKCCVGAVNGPGLWVAGCKHKVPAQSQASKVESSPKGIHTSAGRWRACFVENVGRRIVSAIAVSRARANTCVVDHQQSTSTKDRTACLQRNLQSSKLVMVRCSTWDS